MSWHRRQEPVWTIVRGAYVKAVSPAELGRSEATRLDVGEHTRTLFGLTMPPATYGAESAPLYRAYLSACAVLDYSARNGHGITQQIGAPELNQHGKPLRSKDGRIIRSTRETIPNPAAKFVGKLTDDDVRRLVGLHAQHHENRKRARALERLDSDGVIDLRTFRDGCVQIFAPGQEH